MGLVAGTKNFAKHIKNKYMPKEPNEEIPQQKRKKDDFEIEHLLEKASSILKCDIEVFKNSRRISQTAKISFSKRFLQAGWFFQENRSHVIHKTF